MNMVASMSSFSTGKIELPNYIVSWVNGGRIKVENLATKIVTFHDYSAHILKKVLELCDPKQNNDDDRTMLYFNSASFEILGQEHVEILQDETAFFIIPKKTAGPGTRKLCSDSGSQNRRHFELSARNCNLKQNARYLLEADGELSFLEDITPENFGAQYDEPVINVYRVRSPRKK